jgi:hypothetical protein
MNLFKKIFPIFVVLALVLLAAPKPALAAPPAKVVLGDSYTLGSGQTLDEDLVVLGGMVTLEEDSTVNGDVMIMGGTLDAAGTINGNLTAAGGVVSLGATAVVTGDLSTLGAQVERHQDAVVEGETLTNQDLPFGVVPGTWQDRFAMPSGPARFLDLGWFILRVVLWGLLAILVVMFLPVQVERVRRGIISQPVISGGLGIATALILPLLLVVLALTICLIPISILGFLLLGAAWAFGLIALGLELGRRFSKVFNQEWHPALAAGVGTFMLTLLLNGLSAIIPCVGWIPQVIVGALGLGSVLLTRFGTQEYTNGSMAIEAVEPPPAL